MELRDSMPVELNNLPSGHRQVVQYIEATLEQIISQIQLRPHGEPKIFLKRIASFEPYLDPDLNEIAWRVISREVVYGWPGKTKEEAWRFACVSRIFVEIHAAITAGLKVTKRDIYYRDPTLFKKQEVVDRYIDDVAFTCRVTRRDLNVGLCAGLDKRSDKTGIVPEDLEAWSRESLDHVRWVLVVEKEAVFKTLTEMQFQVNAILGKGVVATAKGYPDLATRRFLRLLTDRLAAATPVFGLFDADPDGLEILKCYLVGSRALAQEVESSVPEMRWLGVSLNDVLLHSPDSCSSLTARDRNKARLMLAKPEWQGDYPALDHRFRRDMQLTLMLNMKAEIQALDKKNGLVKWLVSKMAISVAD